MATQGEGSGASSVVQSGDVSTISVLKDASKHLSGYSIKPIVLDDTNHFRWATSWKANFKVQGHWPLPVKSEATTPEQERVLTQLYIVILHHVAAHIQPLVMNYEDDPAGAWNALETRFAGKTIHHIDILKNSLRNLEYNSSITKLVGDARTLGKQLSSVGKEYADSELLMDILRALPATFDPVRTSLKMTFTTLEQAELVLLDWERELKSRMNKELAVAMYGKEQKQQFRKKGFKFGACFECGSMEHHKKKCPKWLAKQTEKESVEDARIARVAPIPKVIEEAPRPRAREVYEVAF
jgi:hypothetical protein